MSVVCPTSNNNDNGHAALTESNGCPIDISSLPNVEIFIHNIVCTFHLGCHLNLKKVALNTHNVEYKKETGRVLLKLRNPTITANIWSSGKVMSTGATSYEDSKRCARRIARIIQKIGFNVRFSHFNVVNILGTCSLPFGIKLQPCAQNVKEITYEPELHPAAMYKLKNDPGTPTLKIFSTGSITVTARSIEAIQRSIEHIYPILEPYSSKKVQSANIASQYYKSSRHEVLMLDETEFDSEYNSEDDEDDGWHSS